MMNTLKSFLSIMILVLMILTALPSGVFAGEGTLTLEEARESALANSRSLAKYNLAVRSALLEEKTQWYSDLPSLSLGASASTTLWTKDGIPENLYRDSFDAGASAGLSQKVNIWDGGKNGILKQINSLSSESARQDALAEYYAVLDTADAAYYGVLQAAANLEAAEISLETAVLNLSTAEIQKANGMLSEAGYLQAQAEKESRDLSRGQARRDLSLSLVKLKNLTGLETVSGLEAPDFEALENFIGTLAVLDDAGADRLCDALEEEITRRNPGLLKAGINSGKAEKNVSLAQRDYSPTLSASLSAGLSYTLNKGLEPQPGQLSLNLTVPLDFWVTAANVEKRQIALEQAALDYASSAESLDTQIQSCALDLISQAGQVVSAGRALAYAQKHYEYTAELFSLSRVSLSELSNAEALARSGRTQLIKAQYGVLQAVSKIRSLGVFETEETVIELVMNAAEG